MAMQRTKTPKNLTMTYEEFLEWADEDVHAEWVDGEVIQFMPPDEHHQDISVLLSFLFKYLVDIHDLGKIWTAPFEMKLSQSRSSREPDLLFVATENLGRLDGKRVQGPADLVVEIVSPESVSRDRLTKFREYAAVGVKEYWIVDPRSASTPIRIFELTDDRSYRLIEADESGRLHSRVMAGMWLRPEWLTQDPLPRAPDLIHEILSIQDDAI
jgi:Uma2 family endonuclease